MLNINSGLVTTQEEDFVILLMVITSIRMQIRHTRRPYEAVDVRNLRMHKLFKPYITLSREQEVMRV